MKTFADAVRNLNEDVQTVVAIGNRTHWIFTENDEIDEAWAESFEVTEIISETKTSVIFRIALIEE